MPGIAESLMTVITILCGVIVFLIKREAKKHDESHTQLVEEVRGFNRKVIVLQVEQKNIKENIHEIKAKQATCGCNV